MTLSIPTGAGNVNTANAGAASSVTLTKPTNTADGDVLVVGVFFRNSGGTITTPAGWTLLGPLDNVVETFAMYYKPIPTASAETATTYAFSSSAGSSRALGIIGRFPGINLSSIVDSASVIAPHTGLASVVIPATTAVATDTLLVAFAIDNNATTGVPSVISPPAGMTTVGTASADNGTSATAYGWLGAQILSVSGTTGSRTPTIAPNASNSGGMMVTLTGIAVIAPAASVAPDELVSSTGWAASTGTIVGVTGDRSDTTYAFATLTTSDQILREGFASLTPSPTGATLRVRCALSVSATTTTSVKVYVDGSGTPIKTQTIAPDSIQDFLVPLSSADLSGVVDWSTFQWSITSRV